MIPHQLREGSWNEPVATKTKIGWAVYGRTRGASETKIYSCSIHEFAKKRGGNLEEMKTHLESAITPAQTNHPLELGNFPRKFKDPNGFEDRNLKVETSWKAPQIEPTEKMASTSHGNSTIGEGSQTICTEGQSVKNATLSSSDSEKIGAEKVDGQLWDCNIFCLILIVLAIKLTVILFAGFDHVGNTVKIMSNLIYSLKRHLKVYVDQYAENFENKSVKWRNIELSRKQFGWKVGRLVKEKEIDQITGKPHFSKVPKARLFIDKEMSRDSTSFLNWAWKMKVTSWKNWTREVLSKLYNQHRQTILSPPKLLDVVKPPHLELN
jgi:hypothetical protein